MSRSHAGKKMLKPFIPLLQKVNEVVMISKQIMHWISETHRFRFQKLAIHQQELL